MAKRTFSCWSRHALFTGDAEDMNEHTVTAPCAEWAEAGESPCCPGRPSHHLVTETGWATFRKGVIGSREVVWVVKGEEIAFEAKIGPADFSAPGQVNEALEAIRSGKAPLGAWIEVGKRYD